MKYLALLALAALGVGAGTALATDYHPPLHPTTGDECTVLHPCEPVHPPTTDTIPVHPPVTVTVTTPAPPAVTVTTPAPPAVTVTTSTSSTNTVTTPGKTVTVTKPYPPCARGWNRQGDGNCYRVRVVTKWKTRTVVQQVVRTKIVHDRCPPPKVCCEGKG